MDSSVELDPSVFPYQDVRYKGTRGRNTGTKPKVKKDSKLSPVFAKPEVPKQRCASVPTSIGVGDERGEKDKPKRRATPSPSPVRDGAVGGKVHGGNSVDGNSSGALPNINNTGKSVAKLNAPIGGKGECGVVIIVVYFVI